MTKTLLSLFLLVASLASSQTKVSPFTTVGGFPVNGVSQYTIDKVAGATDTGAISLGGFSYGTVTPPGIFVTSDPVNPESYLNQSGTVTASRVDGPVVGLCRHQVPLSYALNYAFDFGVESTPTGDYHVTVVLSVPYTFNHCASLGRGGNEGPIYTLGAGSGVLTETLQ